MKGDEPVSRIMCTEFVSLATSDRLDFVDDVMNLGRIRHMPVLGGERLVGIVSQRDLLAASLSRTLEFEHDQRRSFMHSVEVGEVMTKNPITVSPETPLSEAARLMVHHKIGCVPVVDAEGAPQGLVTETDLLRGLFEVDSSEGGSGPA